MSSTPVPGQRGFINKYDIILVEKDRFGNTRERPRDMWFIHNKRLVTWLCSIQPRRVNEENRDTLVKIQTESAEVLYQYWSGKVVNSQSSKISCLTIILYIKGFSPSKISCLMRIEMSCTYVRGDRIST